MFTLTLKSSTPKQPECGHFKNLKRAHTAIDFMGLNSLFPFDNVTYDGRASEAGVLETNIRKALTIACLSNNNSRRDAIILT